MKVFERKFGHLQWSKLRQKIGFFQKKFEEKSNRNRIAFFPPDKQYIFPLPRIENMNMHWFEIRIFDNDDCP